MYMYIYITSGMLCIVASGSVHAKLELMYNISACCNNVNIQTTHVPVYHRNPVFYLVLYLFRTWPRYHQSTLYHCRNETIPLTYVYVG